MTISNLVACSTGRSAGFRALEDLAGVDADLAIRGRVRRAVGEETAGCSVFAPVVDRRNPVTRRERDDAARACR